MIFFCFFQVSTGSSEECQQLCHQTEGCVWFSFSAFPSGVINSFPCISSIKWVGGWSQNSVLSQECDPQISNLTLFTNQCNVFLYMIIQVPRAQAHAKKPKATYCLFTYFLGFYNYRGEVTNNNTYHWSLSKACLHKYFSLPFFPLMSSN